MPRIPQEPRHSTAPDASWEGSSSSGLTTYRQNLSVKTNGTQIDRSRNPYHTGLPLLAALDVSLRTCLFPRCMRTTAFVEFRATTQIVVCASTVEGSTYLCEMGTRWLLPPSAVRALGWGFVRLLRTSGMRLRTEGIRVSSTARFREKLLTFRIWREGVRSDFAVSVFASVSAAARTWKRS